MSRDGSSSERLSSAGAATPIWLPDGRLLYVAHTEQKSAFHLVSATGEELMRIPVPPPMTTVGGVSWGPDGTAVAFAGKTEGSKTSYDIYGLKLGEGEGPPAIWQIVQNGIQPSWSPDGQRLCFVSNRDGNLELFLVDSDGGNLRNLTRHEGYDARPSWSPDGRRIAFESDRVGNREICIIDIASGEVVRVTDHPGRDGQPAWSHDGLEIAFMSDRDGKASIFRMVADGSGVTRLTPPYDEDWEPAWSPDGQSICFVSNRVDPPLDS